MGIQLFSPFTLREITLKNRIVVSPMCQYSSEDGFANDWHLVHLGTRAIGGAALVMTEATAVSPEGRISIDDLGIWKDDHVEFLKRITDFIIRHDAVPGIQLAHAGRKGSRTSPWKGDSNLPEDGGAWKTVAPSAIPFSPDYSVPESLSAAGIAKVTGDFRSAALRALEAGFRVAEIHAAHGYLLHEFLSPLTNKRTDEYGGSFENRCRLLMEVVKVIRAVWPEKYPVFVRLSCIDWTDEGIRIEDSVALARLLKEEGVDLVDCSSGGIIPGVTIPAAPGYQVPFAAEIRKQTGIPTGAVGIITTNAQAEEILTSGKADLIVMARQLLRDPYFPLHAALESGVEIPWPDQYLRAKRKS